LLGAGIGLLVGGGLGWVVFSSVDEGSIDDKAVAWVLGDITKVSGLGVGLLGLISGTLIGALVGKDETIKIERRSDSEIKQTLEDLRKKARVPNSQQMSNG
jgi:hypothetical protein